MPPVLSLPRSMPRQSAGCDESWWILFQLLWFDQRILQAENDE